MGCDLNLLQVFFEGFPFLLTHPVWDVTIKPWLLTLIPFYFYSHIPCGMWLNVDICRFFVNSISTHTSRVGCDKKRQYCGGRTAGFLLTHPVWDVTDYRGVTVWIIKISTHTSRVGCDGPYGMETTCVENFYSHIPCGMWLWCPERKTDAERFLLTHPVWDVTISSVFCFVVSQNFYSHIPCGMWHALLNRPGKLFTFLLTHPVWDVTSIRSPLMVTPIFLLTHPVWDVTVPIDSYRSLYVISTHTSRVGCDADTANNCIVQGISTHTSRVGCDANNRRVPIALYNFYSHIPCGMWLFR